MVDHESVRARVARIACLCMYYGFARYIPNYPYRVGERLRAILCKGIFRKHSSSIRIGKWAYIGTGREIEIGENSSIGISCKVYGIGGGGELIVGNDVMMAPEVVILTVKHQTLIDSPVARQGNFPTRVVIENGVWVGTRAIILPGVRIAEGSIVGAGAVVTRNVPPFSVVGGVPARVIKNRRELT